MSAASRTLALNFLDHHPINLLNEGEVGERLLGNNYLLYRGRIIAKWEEQIRLFINIDDGSKPVLDRLNAILLGYGCCLSVRVVQNRTFIINESLLSTDSNYRTAVQSGTWYYIRKDGLAIPSTHIE